MYNLYNTYGMNTWCICLLLPPGHAAGKRWSPEDRHLCTSLLCSASSPHQRSAQKERARLGTHSNTLAIHVASDLALFPAQLFSNFCLGPSLLANPQLVHVHSLGLSLDHKNNADHEL